MESPGSSGSEERDQPLDSSSFRDWEYEASLYWLDRAFYVMNRRRTHGDSGLPEVFVSVC